MKKVLIISPAFPPFNTADMQRVRQTLPYLKQFGWEATVMAVEDRFVESYSTDDLLLHTVPADVRVLKVPALDAKFTRKVGLGSLSLRAFYSMRKRGDALLRREKFDLVYFSTTAFHVMALGPRWKRKFGVPFVLDIQDPWYNTFYFENALSKKTLKATLFHKLDKYLEQRTLPHADGIVSVSPGYRELYLKRYRNLRPEDFRVIPFGCAENDFAVAEEHVAASRVSFSPDETNAVYIGRGGEDMQRAAAIIFEAVKLGLEREPALFRRLRLWFIGTSYAQAGQGGKTFAPVAEAIGVADRVTEISDRLPYFETLHLLAKADVLVVPGSTDATYTASKIYPYIYLNKPLLAVFHRESSVVEVIRATSKGEVVTFGDGLTVGEQTELARRCFAYLADVLQGRIVNTALNHEAFRAYTAESMTQKQTDFFNQIIASKPVGRS